MEKVLMCNNCKLIWLDEKECTCGCKTLTATHESNKEYAKNYTEANHSIRNIIQQRLDEGVTPSLESVLTSLLNDVLEGVGLIYEVRRRAYNCLGTSKVFINSPETQESFRNIYHYLNDILDEYNDIKEYIM